VGQPEIASAIRLFIARFLWDLIDDIDLLSFCDWIS